MVGLNCYVDPTVELNCETFLLSIFYEQCQRDKISWLARAWLAAVLAARAIGMSYQVLERKGKRESEKEISLGAPSESRLPKFR